MALLGDLPEIGAGLSVEKYHKEFIEPGMQMIMMQIKALAAKLEQVSRDNKSITVEVKIPENITITLQHRDVL